MTVAAIAVAGVGAAAAVGSTMMANKAQNKATGQAQQGQQQNAETQYKIAGQNVDANNRLIDDKTRAAMGYVAPFVQGGVNANLALQQQMGLAPDAQGNMSSPLTQNFTAQDWQNDAGYTAPTSNQFTREQYSQMAGVPALVSNTLTADEWKNDGTGTYTATPTTLAELQATPGYQFQLEQGLQGVDRTAAARGGLLSGRTLKEANNYAQGQASTGFADAWARGQQAYQNAFARKNQQFQQGQEGYANQYARQQQQYQQGQDSLQNAYSRYGQNQDRAYNKLSGLAASGQNAASELGGYQMQAAQMGINNNNNYANNLSGSSQNYADNTGNLALGQGQNNANAARQIGNTVGSSLTDLAGKYYASTAGTSAGVNTGQYQTNNAVNGLGLTRK